jgi:dihydrofolate reductase
MGLNLIFACSDNGVIGKDNTLPWHLPEDLAHFRQLTLGSPVLMGRKTWDSLPPRFRPLPGRLNLVLTRQPDWDATGAVRVGSIEQALSQCPTGQDLWVIGGAEVYEMALPLAQRLEITEVHVQADGDVKAPFIDRTQWQESARVGHTAVNGLDYSFVTWIRPPH